MPGFDRTGPMGNGPITGGGFGRCAAGVGRGQRHRRFQHGPPIEGPPAIIPEPMSTAGQLNRLEAALASIEARLARIEGSDALSAHPSR